MKIKQCISLLSTALIGSCLFCKITFAETPEELKAQIESLKKQMSVMQQQMASMQNLIETLQNKLKKVQAQQTEALKSSIAKHKSNPVYSKPGVKWQIYGRIKVDYNYDTARMEKYNDFIGAVANRVNHPDYKNDSTNFNPRDTRLGALIYHKSGNWLIKGHIEMDFYGDNNGNNLIPRMRLAYVEMFNNNTKTDVRIGQDWIPVAQLNPSTVDFGILTAAGNLWWRIPQITVRQKVFNNLELLGSVMKHRRISTASKERMPWIVGRIQYTNGILGKGNMIAIGGGYKHETVTSEDVSFPNIYFSDKDIDRWLVAGEWKFNFNIANQKFLFKGEAWNGKGLDKEFLRYDLGVNAYGEPIEAWGMWSDLTWFFSPRWSFTIGFGFDDPNDSEILKGQTGPADLNDRQFTKNTQYFANVWYKFTDNLKIGAEFLHVETERDNFVDTGNRFTLSTFYNF